MGRPTKLDDTILLPGKDGNATPRVRWEVIVERIKAGGIHAEVAAASVGVAETTYYRWMAQGEDRWEDGKLRRARSPYREFREAVTRARAEAESANVAIIVKAAGEDWKASAWYLERSRPERWRRRDTVYGAGPADGDPALPVRTVRIDVDPSASERLGELLDLVERAGAKPERGPGDSGPEVDPDPGSPEPVRSA